MSAAHTKIADAEDVVVYTDAVVLYEGSDRVALSWKDWDRISAFVQDHRPKSFAILVGFVNRVLYDLNDEDRVNFIQQLGMSFCVECGRKLQTSKGEHCQCWNDE